MLIVQKYGGVTLETPEKIKAAALRISNIKNTNHQVVAVVSAMGKTTNQLLDLSQQVSKTPLLRELDMLLSVGERISMSLVSIALNDLGHQAISLTGSQAGILTTDLHLNAMITDVKAHRVSEALEKNKIVIIAGFQGVSPVTKEITTLGRGGTDTTAVAMAIYLKADRCEILKDVDSIFSADPKLIPKAKPIKKLSYGVLLEMTFWGAQVLHYRSVELAFLNQVNLYIGPASENPNHQSTESEKIGTAVNKDIMFETTKPIAVNSHQSVFKISILQTDEFKNLSHKKSSFDFLISVFRDHQIATPQILHGYVIENEMKIYITAPNESLMLIKNLALKNQFFKLESQSLCSVSLTCTGSSLNEVLLQSQDKLDEKNIEILAFTQSSMSLNFFIDQKDKASAVEALHQLIN